MRPVVVISAIVLLCSLLPAQGAPLRTGIGVFYLYPAGRLSEALNGGAEVEVSLLSPALSRIDLGVSIGYATLGGKENEHLKVALSPFQLILRMKVMELTETSSILLDAGLGVIGICRTLNSGREGAFLAGEGMVSLGLGSTIPFRGQAIDLRIVYHRVLDPLERANLFSLGGSILY